MIADIIIIIILLLFISIGIRRGIVKTLLNVAEIVITCFASSHLSKFLAKLIYETFLKQTVSANIDSMIWSNGAEYALSNCLTALPQWAKGIVEGAVKLFNNDFWRVLFKFDDKVYTSFIGKSAEYIKNLVQELCVSVFGMILLILLFIIIFILVRKLLRPVAGVCKLPVLKQIDRFFGGLLGFVYGIIITILAVNIFYAVVIMPNPQFAQSEMLNGNIFKLLCIFI